MLNLGVSMAIGVFFTPYLLRCLGKSLYGLIPLSNTVVSYLAVATAGLQIAVSRFVATALEQGDEEGASRIFSTATLGLFGVAALLTIPLGLLSWRGDWILRVPQENIADLRYLLAYCGASFLVSTVTSSFGVSLFYRNRFDIQHWISLGSNLLRVGLTVLAFSLVSPRLWHVGMAILAAGVAVGIGNLVTWRNLTPHLVFRVRLWKQAEFNRIIQTAGWVLIAQVGTILLVGIDLLVVNRLFGPVANTQYAVALQWSVLLRGLASTLATLFGADITALNARGNLPGLIAYTRKSNKFMGLVLALPVGLICGLSRPLLHTWVGAEYLGIAPLMVVLTLPLAVNLAYLPLHNVSLATNRVKWPGIMQIAFGAVNLALALVLGRFTPLGMYGVAIAGGLVLTLRNLLWTPIYAAHILDQPWGTFMKEVLPCLLAAIGVSLVGWALSFFWYPVGWPALGCAAAVVGVAYCATSYAVLFSPVERREARLRIASLIPWFRFPPAA